MHNDPGVTAYDPLQLGFPPDRLDPVSQRAGRLLDVIDVLGPFEDALGVSQSREEYRFHAERIARNFAVPGWVQGRISLVEAAVLDLFVRVLRPEVIVEVGVASGVSSAALLSSLSSLGASSTARLHSYDIMTHCYFDGDRAVGEATGKMVPSLVKDQRLVRGGARTASDELPARSVRLAFIDANHGHPAPTADLIDLAPCLAPGAWVVLHDVHLSRVMLERDLESERQVYGVEVLFDAWPGLKAQGVRFSRNIGAIRVDDPEAVTPESLRGVIDLDWEPIADSAHVRRTLGREPMSHPV